MRFAAAISLLALLTSCIEREDEPKQQPLQAQLPKTNYWVCRVAWDFDSDGFADKEYHGTGLTERLAYDDAVLNCIADQGVSGQVFVCRGDPRVKQCYEEKAPVDEPGAPGRRPELLYCAGKNVRAPGGAIPGTTVDLGTRGSGPAQFGTSVVHVPAQAKAIQVYCRISDASGESWCGWTPHKPEGCDYWAIGKAMSLRWGGTDWEVTTKFENESRDRFRKLQTFATYK